MKNLLLTLLLISPASFADWGDVYYCQMTNFSQTTLEGKRTDYTLDKFQFKLDKTKRAMVFGISGVFAYIAMGLEAESYPSQEHWFSGSIYSKGFFLKGKFVTAGFGVTENWSVISHFPKFSLRQDRL